MPTNTASDLGSIPANPLAPSRARESRLPPPVLHGTSRICKIATPALLLLRRPYHRCSARPLRRRSTVYPPSRGRLIARDPDRNLRRHDSVSGRWRLHRGKSSPAKTRTPAWALVTHYGVHRRKGLSPCSAVSACPSTRACRVISG